MRWIHMRSYSFQSRTEKLHVPVKLWNQDIGCLLSKSGKDSKLEDISHSVLYFFPFNSTMGAVSSLHAAVLVVATSHCRPGEGVNSPLLRCTQACASCFISPDESSFNGRTEHVQRFFLTSSHPTGVSTHAPTNLQQSPEHEHSLTLWQRQGIQSCQLIAGPTCRDIQPHTPVGNL